jgi:dTDP-glucose 4,6-dehydratase
MNMRKPILVTGGAGFIRSNFILQWIRTTGVPVINLDLLTYAGNPANLGSLDHEPRYRMIRGDICDANLVATLLRDHNPGAIVHLAAESHVDRSITGPDAFIQTNIHGTFTLLEQARIYWSGLDEEAQRSFRFLHVSTDEVFGSLAADDAAFSEAMAYAPNNPYAASKAASDHLVRAYFHTYGLPVVTTNCSNNYGPFQFPEKLIPLMTLNGLEGKRLPVYGDGNNSRDWLFVDNHCSALQTVLSSGRIGETYNIGGNNERTNLQVVTAVCTILDKLRPDPSIGERRKLITFVADRPGHDRRYAMDTTKITHELGWKPSVEFEEGLTKTIAWYLENHTWIENVKTGAYKNWIRTNYEERILS